MFRETCKKNTVWTSFQFLIFQNMSVRSMSQSLKIAFPHLEHMVLRRVVKLKTDLSLYIYKNNSSQTGNAMTNKLNPSQQTLLYKAFKNASPTILEQDMLGLFIFILFLKFLSKMKTWQHCLQRWNSVRLLWFLTVTCSCSPYLFFGSAIMLVTYFVNFR